MKKVELKRTKQKVYSFQVDKKEGSYSEVFTKNSVDAAITLANIYLRDEQYNVGEIYEKEVEQFQK